MSPLALGLFAAGIGVLAVAIWRARGPQARLGELDRLAENSKRYESWRGGRKTAAVGGETTGADVMRDMLRREVRQWAAVGVAGVGLIVAGFLLLGG
ncbi:MAG TPA: hypothetical protein VM305_02830 [Candidatus Limnocylindrales bacterium]|nr:hypothetical protein [Candidatus Limnocylindrales bacterium]